MLSLADIVYKDGIKEYLETRIEIARKYDAIFLFGSARGGEKVYQYLKQENLCEKIKYVVDNDKMKHGKRFNGIQIISAEELQQKFNLYNQAAIIIASGSAHIIKKQLIDMGFSEDVIYPFVITNLEACPTPYEYFVTKKDQISKVYNLLADERSKDIFISLLNYKMTRDEQWLINISDDETNQYFDDLMNLSEAESFVDCGAYIGDTLDIFNEKVRGSWKNYYCFEADKAVFQQLQKNIQKKGYENVLLFNVGCWNEKAILYFNEQGSGSSSVIEEEAQTKIVADTVDNILGDEKVTILKMDIEGAEQNALNGCNNIITTQHPKLAISIYHSLEDFIFIPSMLASFNYQIYIRHYRAMTDSETICYAI